MHRLQLLFVRSANDNAGEGKRLGLRRRMNRPVLAATLVMMAGLVLIAMFLAMRQR